ncbi:MAG TPA: hypothetical protein VK638_17835 [Edaphobacter sp.]|nr:hypothetical protein [Edaphobacter sp.]
MIDQGLVLLLQGSPAVAAIAPTGGFNTQLPPDKQLPSWTFQLISSPSDLTLQGPISLTMARYQFDCYGQTKAQTILLAKAINDVLDGFAGMLTDPDATIVQVAVRSNMLDFFDDDARNYRRMLEYQIQYVAP